MAGKGVEVLADGTLVAGRRKTVCLAGNQTLTASTVGSTFQAVDWEDGATLALAANSVTKLVWQGAMTSTGTGEGYSLRIEGPSDMTGEIWASLMPSATNPSMDVQTPTSGAVQLDQATAIGATARHFHIDALLRSTTGGTLTLKFRTESTSGSNTVTMRANAYAELERIK